MTRGHSDGNSPIHTQGDRPIRIKRNATEKITECCEIDVAFQVVALERYERENLGDTRHV